MGGARHTIEPSPAPLCVTRRVSSVQVASHFATSLHGAGEPELRALCCIGGTSLKEQMDAIRPGVHMVVAT